MDRPNPGGQQRVVVVETGFEGEVADQESLALAFGLGVNAAIEPAEPKRGAA